MTILELKTEIHRAVDTAPVNALPDILKFINSTQKSPSNAEDLESFIERVFKEDDNLLRRLAQ